MLLEAMKKLSRPGLTLCASLGIALTLVATLMGTSPVASAPSSATSAATPVGKPGIAGMPPVVDPLNVYSETASDKLSPVVSQDLPRVYVPHVRTHDVYVIDPQTLKVVDRFKVGRAPQHIVPSWDLRTLWVANNAERHSDGSLTPLDPKTGKPGQPIPVDDPYNLYFTPDGQSAIVVAEARKRLDFRDPHTFAMQYSIETPSCGGINHADFAPDGRSAIFTCEFDGTIVKVDLVGRKVEGYLKLTMPATRFKGVKSAEAFDPSATEVCTSTKGMPQDIRISPDGSRYYIADMSADGVHVVDAAQFKEIGFIPTGLGAHGLYPSRDGKQLYVANRGTHKVHGPKRGPGGVSVIDFATNRVVKTWMIPGGGSPDMGNVSVDGRWLWLAGRYDDRVYRIDTTTGAVDSIKVGGEPHGLTVWPLPGRYSLGHTGNLR